MSNFEQEGTSRGKLVVSTENVEDLLQELNERNPRALSNELKMHLARRSVNGAGIGIDSGEDKENNQGGDGREERT